MHALERAATVAALLITREQAVAAVENKYRGDFLRDVFLAAPATRPTSRSTRRPSGGTSAVRS